jgi:DNA processing protein
MAYTFTGGMPMADKVPNSTAIEYWLALIRADGVGPVTFLKLVRHFGSPQAALGASVHQLASVEGVGTKTAEQIARSRDRFNVQEELTLADRLGVWLVHIEDPRYPPGLKAIYDPPPVLYIKGQLQREHQLAVSIVGSRHCSLYGQEQASRLAHLLAGAGFTIVSGMARGIDTAAHQGALSAGGRTLAVQGCGLANVFPPENHRLFDLISQSGACLSELPLRYEPLAENFPNRNRIIAGLSVATIVVEAGLRSGALITARCALENNREVMAVPGRVDSPLSKGPHHLLRQGAVLVESPQDVLDALGQIGTCLKGPLDEASSPSPDPTTVDRQERLLPGLNYAEKAVYEGLSSDPAHTDQIVADTGSRLIPAIKEFNVTANGSGQIIAVFTTRNGFPVSSHVSSASEHVYFITFNLILSKRKISDTIPVIF